MPIITKNFKDHFAYDLSKNIITKGEIWDDDVIKQSIEMILATHFGERIFNPNFGSELPFFLFENLTESTGEQLLTSIINSIKRWEDRVEVLENQCRMILYPDQNSISLTIAYRIKKNNIVSRFEKKIIL